MIDGECLANATDCVTFHVAATQRCKHTVAVDNKTFYDNMNATFSPLVDGKTFGKGLTYTQNKTTGFGHVHLPVNSIWRVNLIDMSFTDKPFYCVVKTTKDGWEYAKGCQQVSNNENCTGCRYMNAQDARTGNQHAMFSVGCTPGPNYGVAGYGHAYLLDYKNGNFLFRGPQPGKTVNGNWTFDAKGLINTMNSRANSQLKKALPDSFHLIDISLISNVSSKEALDSEISYFKGNPSTPIAHAYTPSNSTGVKVNVGGTQFTGQLLWWNMLGGETGATDSDLNGLVNEVTRIMNKKFSVPRVIYLHCSAGEDRTGEVAISYLLNNRMKKNTNAAYVYGTTIFTDPTNGKLGRTTPKNPVDNFFEGVKWYCAQNSSRSCDFSDTTTVPGDQEGTCLYPWSKDKEPNACVWAGQN
ncbi:hypothetical protein [Maridesulfovibrio sp.]|uniref:hypothetical protein n=1 Tax=Maridesulfovibrio sp. TaxID=2795000 RepID=UPI003BA9BEEC